MVIKQAPVIETLLTLYMQWHVKFLATIINVKHSYNIILNMKSSNGNHTKLMMTNEQTIFWHLLHYIHYPK